MGTDTSPARWEPDEQMVPALLASGNPCTMADLSGPDRCWAVAGMRAAGLTAEQIADRLDCSLRLVRAVLAEPMTAVCSYAATETGHFADELRLARRERAIAEAAAADAAAEAERLNRQLGRLIEVAAEPTHCSHGHRLTPGNVYVHPVSGRRWCKRCRARHSEEYRARHATPA